MKKNFKLAASLTLIATIILTMAALFSISSAAASTPEVYFKKLYMKNDRCQLEVKVKGDELNFKLKVLEAYPLPKEWTEPYYRINAHNFIKCGWGFGTYFSDDWDKFERSTFTGSTLKDVAADCGCGNSLFIDGFVDVRMEFDLAYVKKFQITVNGVSQTITVTSTAKEGCPKTFSGFTVTPEAKTPTTTIPTTTKAKTTKPATTKSPTTTKVTTTKVTSSNTSSKPKKQETSSAKSTISNTSTTTLAPTTTTTTVPISQSTTTVPTSETVAEAQTTATTAEHTAEHVDILPLEAVPNSDTISQSEKTGDNNIATIAIVLGLTAAVGIPAAIFVPKAVRRWRVK